MSGRLTKPGEGCGVVWQRCLASCGLMLPTYFHISDWYRLSLSGSCDPLFRSPSMQPGTVRQSAGSFTTQHMPATDVIIQDCIPGSIQKAKLRVRAVAVVVGGVIVRYTDFSFSIAAPIVSAVGWTGTARRLISHLVLTLFSGQTSNPGSSTDKRRCFDKTPK